MLTNQMLATCSIIYCATDEDLVTVVLSVISLFILLVNPKVSKFPFKEVFVSEMLCLQLYFVKHGFRKVQSNRKCISSKKNLN